MRRIALVVLLIIRLTDVSSQSTKNYVKLINSNTSSATYYNNYFSYYNEERIAKEGELNFRQMDFSPLNIEIKWCKKILFVNVCGTETKKIEFGLVLSGKDVPGNESSFDDKRFGTITDMTAFSNEFISDYTLFKNIVLTAAILDNGGRKITFLREGLVPWDYGINQGESRFVNPISIKYIGGFLYILDNTITPNVKVIKINHSPDGNFNVNYVGDINNTSLGFNLSNPTDITGYFDTDNNSNVLLIADEAGLHKIRLNSTGLINSTTSVSTFLYAENSYNTNIAYDLTDIYKIDSDNSGYTLAILKDNKVISFPNIENNISNTVGVANVTFLNRNLFPTGIAYMFTEQKWYITDITGKIHSFTKDGKFINTAGTVGKGEGNNELYLPNVITPNPISDPQNDFRYRFIIGNNWGYETGFKLFVPYVTIPEISVFESLQDNSLNFSFITSSSWEVVEKATGIQMSKVLINGTEINASLWNSQITSGNDLTSYPNVFTIHPTLLPNLNRGWNNVEIQLQLSYSDRGPELIKNKTSFYWLPSQFTGTTSDYQFINSSTGIDFIYKPTTLSGAALMQVNQLLYVTEEGNLTMQENSTFYNPPTVANDFSNIRFFSEETSKISIENGAYFCMSSLISPSGITPPSTAQFALDPGYKTGKNPVITGLSSICKSPCYTLADDKPKAVATAQAFFNTANSRYEAYIDSRGSTYSNSLRYVITKLDINRNETAVSATVLGIGSAPDRLLVNDLFSGFSLENQNEYKIKVTLGCNSDQGQAVPEWIEGSTVTTIIGLKTELKLGDPQAFCERQTVGSITGFSPLSTLVGYTDAGTPKSGFWSGPGVNFAGVISITGDLPRNVAINYVYTYTDALNFTQTAIKTITITSAPSVSQFGTNSPVCAGKSLSFTCVGTGIAGESKYFWSGPNNFYRVTSYPETYLQDADISANGIYTVSLAGNACVGDPATVTGVVYSLPGVSAGLDEEFCVGVADYTITGFSPEGGLWQGIGIVNSTSGFNTVVSGAGAFPVNYYYTDANGCSAKATKNITVGPLITTGGVQFVCKSDVAVVLTVVSPVGGNWVLDGNTLAGGVFTPSIPGSYIVTYEFNNGSCINTAVKTVTVRDLPIPPAISSNSPVCKGTNLLITITGVETGTGITYEWLGSEGFSSVVRLPTRFNVAESMGGEYKLRIRQNGCGDSDVFATTTVTVNTLPIVDAGTYAPICFGNNITLTGTPANGTWTGANLVGNVFTPVAYGTKSFTYTYTDLNGCTNRTTTSVIVNPQNTVTILGLSQNNICRPSLINPVFLVADPTAGGGNDINPNFAFQWSKDGILIQGATGQGYTTDVSGNYCVTVTSDCGNIAIDCYNLNIVDVPVYTVSAPASLCLPGGSGQLQVAIANAVANQNYHLTILQDGIEKYNQTVAGSTFPYNSPVTSAGAFEVRLENASAYNSCKAVNQTKTVLGYSPPTIAMATIPSTICFNAAAINLNATPVGGVWSGNGVAGNQFVPGSSPIGVQTITYSVTGANGCSTSAGVSIDVKPALEITQQPSDVGACSGSSASFSVVANGVKTYKWQYLNGANWTNINTSTTAGHSIASTTLSLNGRQYRCVLTGLCSASQTSNAATLTVKPLPTIVKNPSNVTRTEDQTAIFNVSATGAGAITYQWQEKTPTGSWTNIAETSTSYTILGVSPFQSGNQYKAIVSMDGCTKTSNIATLNVNINRWTGAVNTDWNTAGNWSGGLPSATKSGYIKLGAANMPTINSTSAAVKSLYIDAGCTLTMATSSQLKVYGNWLNNGTFISNNSAVNFLGTVPQTIGGSSNSNFYDVNMSNTAGVTLINSESVRGTLTLASSTNLASNGNLIIGSDVNGTGRIGVLGAGNVVSGNVTVQRYIPAKRSTRYFSSPVQNASLTQWMSNILITGPGGTSNGFDAGSTLPTVIYYAENTVGSLNFGWTSVPTATSILQTGRGYQVAVRGDRSTSGLSTFASVATSATIMALTGTINQGPYVLPVTYTSTPIATVDGFNLIGNPYPSQIDWNSGTGWVKTSIDNAIYIFDPFTINTNATTSPGSTFSYVSGVSSDGRSNGNIIASSQGFFVKANAANPSLTINENAKVTSSHKSNFRIESESPEYFNIGILSKNGLSDYTSVRFNENATNDFDSDLDAFKIKNSTINISTQMVDKEELSINSLRFPTNEIEIPIVLEVKTGTGFHLHFTSLENIVTNVSLYLKDSISNSLTEITPDLMLGFDQVTLSRNRFSIIARIDATTSTDKSYKQSKLTLYPNPVIGQKINLRLDSKEENLGYTISDLLGKTYASNVVDFVKGVSSNQVDVSHLPNGLYLFNYQINGITKTKTFIINR